MRGVFASQLLLVVANVIALAIVRPHATTGWYAEYRDLREIGDRVAMLAARHPTLARAQVLGTSVERRPIAALAISGGGKRTIVLGGGQHAREWISVMTPLCVAERILAQHAEPRVRRILDKVSFHVVPVMNPDGYHYTWTVDRYWRKNRRGGHGVDLNRNYSLAWGQAGSSKDKRSPNYRGAEPFSEPETRAMRNLFDRQRVDALIDFHSYAQVIVYPWAHKRAHPPDRDRFAAIADRMSMAMLATHGYQYGVRPGSTLSVGSSGTLGDWAYGERGALAFLIELRPSGGKDGFVLPPEQIVPVCDESLAAVLALAEAVISER